MTANKDTTSKKLLALMDDNRTTARLLPQIIEKTILQHAETTFEKILDPDNDSIFLSMSRIAFKLDAKIETDRPVLRAFEKAGLDCRNPLHWKQLMEMFAEAHFGPSKTKPKRSVSELWIIYQDYLSAKRENPKANESQICVFLQKDKHLKTKYGDYQFDALRKLVRDAKDPEHNVLLRYPDLKDPLLKVLRDTYERAGKQWTPQFEETVTKLTGKFFEHLKADDENKV